MKNRSHHLDLVLISLPDSYIELLAEFPLLPVRNGREYERAAAIIHRLAMTEGKLNAGQRAYLEVLEGILERYDQVNSSLSTDQATPTQLLRMLVEQAGMTVTQLGELLGSKGAASELLSGKRKEPSKLQIAKLCARFKVDAGAFLISAKVPANSVA